MRRKIWDKLNFPGHEVPSPLARRILVHIIRKYRILFHPGIGEEIRQVRYEHILPGSANLWGRLAITDLAERLAGQVQLPDVYDAMPDWAGNWYRMFRPKTLEQQVDQLITHLDWFTAPNRYEPYIGTLQQARSCLMMLAFLVGLVIAVWVSYYVTLTFALNPLMILVFLIALTVPMWYYMRLGKFATTNNEESARIRKRNATVLYHFLLLRFSEPVEGEHR